MFQIVEIPVPFTFKKLNVPNTCSFFRVEAVIIASPIEFYANLIDDENIPMKLRNVSRFFCLALLLLAVEVMIFLYFLAYQCIR